jgi:hypothetical protein
MFEMIDVSIQLLIVIHTTESNWHLYDCSFPLIHLTLGSSHTLVKHAPVVTLMTYEGHYNFLSTKKAMNPCTGQKLELQQNKKFYHIGVVGLYLMWSICVIVEIITSIGNQFAYETTPIGTSV